MTKIYKATFAVGIRRCAMTYNVETRSIECEWSPSKPGKDMLTDPVRMQQYRDGRDALFAEVAKETGQTVAIFET